MNQTKTNDDKETTRMLMEQLEEEAEIHLDEVIKFPPVAISCGTYLDKNIHGETVEYPVVLGSDGNISFIQAYPKVGKSFYISLLVSAYQGGQNKYTGKIRGHRKGRKIIHFDTEQAKFDVQKLSKRPLLMNDIREDDNYHTYYLRAMTYQSRIEFINYILYDKFKGEKIGLIIVDGVADLCGDVNNIEQANFAVQKLMEWSAKLSCHLATVIHQNWGSSKATGHLGSALEKKSELQSKLETNTVNKGWVSVECMRSRNRGFETFSFCINENGLPEFVDNSYDF
jgi:hypothetical protein